MTEGPRERVYRFSALGQLGIGVALLVVGLIAWSAGTAQSALGDSSPFGSLGAIAAIVGFCVTIISVARATRERSRRLELVEEAAEATVSGRPQAAGLAAELERLRALHQQGALSDDEFEQAKGRLLGS